jgi:hypothetical protein
MYYYKGQIDENGTLTDAAARKYQEQHNCSYDVALRCVVREQTAHRYQDNAALLQPVNVPPGLAESYNTVARIVAEFNDASSAAAAVNAAVPGQVISNAGQYLVERARERSMHGSHDSLQVQGMDEAYKIAREAMPNAWSLYDAGSDARMTAAAVTEGFALKRFASSGTSVRRYSSDHVSYDSAGNEIRRYSYDV